MSLTGELLETHQQASSLSLQSTGRLVVFFLGFCFHFRFFVGVFVLDAIVVGDIAFFSVVQNFGVFNRTMLGHTHLSS